MNYIKILVLVFFTSVSTHSHASNELWDTFKCLLWQQDCPQGWSHGWTGDKKQLPKEILVNNKVIYFLWVGQTTEHRETEIIGKMRSWRTLNPDYDVKIYSSHPFNDAELNHSRYSLDSLDQLVTVFSKQEPPHVDLWPYIERLKNKARLDNTSSDSIAKEALIARQILADFYRFLLLKGTYHEREYVFFSEVNNTPFKIDDSKLSEQSLYLVGQSRIAFFGLRKAQHDAEQYATNVIRTYLKNLKWYVDNMDILSLTEKDLSFLFTGISSYNQIFLPSPKISHIAESEYEQTEYAIKRSLKVFTTAYKTPYSKMFWKEKDEFIMNYEFSENVIHHLDRYNARDALFLIKNWLDFYNDRTLFEVRDDTQFKRENIMITSYIKVVVTAMRKELISKAVKGVKSQIKKGDVAYKQAFEGTIFADSAALNQKFDEIYATYLKELFDLNIHKLNDIKSLGVMIYYLSGASEDRATLDNKTLNKDEQKFHDFGDKLVVKYKKLEAKMNGDL